MRITSEEMELLAETFAIGIRNSYLPPMQKADMLRICAELTECVEADKESPFAAGDYIIAQEPG